MRLHVLLLLLFFAFLITGSIVYYLASLKFGELPTGERLERYKQSPQFDSGSRKFRNQNPRDFQRDMDFVALLKGFLLGNEIRVPTHPLPSQKPDLDKLLSKTIDKNGFRLVWLGHSSVLARIADHTILIDPTLSKRVGPIGPFGARFQAQPLNVDELPEIDTVLLSHDHYDHLDYDSIVKLESLRRPTRYIVPLGVGARLESFGVPAEKISELDWWESISLTGLDIVATPAQHFSGRGIGDSLRTLWCGFSIRTPEFSLFYTGDTGYHTHFKEIAEKLGPHDFALVESGQYNQLWRYVHLLPEEVIQAAIDTKSPQIMPLHWGMYTLAFHNWFDPIETVTSLGEQKGIFVHSPTLGQVVELRKGSLPPDGTYKKWWREHPDFKLRNPKMNP